PLVPGKETPAKGHGLLTIKQKAVSKVAEATGTHIKLTPEQIEPQKRFGFTGDNLKAKAKWPTTLTDHAMQGPQLVFPKVARESRLGTDLLCGRPASASRRGGPRRPAPFWCNPAASSPMGGSDAASPRRPDALTLGERMRAGDRLALARLIAHV